MVSEKVIIKSRAQKYLSRGNYEKALREFQKSVQFDPTNLRSLLKAGVLLHKLRRSGEAVAQYKQPAHQYIQEGFLIQAISLNKIILRINPSQEVIDKKLIDLYAQIGISSRISVKGQKAKGNLPKSPSLEDSAEPACPAGLSLQTEEHWGKQVDIRAKWTTYILFHHE